MNKKQKILYHILFWVFVIANVVFASFMTVKYDIKHTSTWVVSSFTSVLAFGMYTLLLYDKFDKK